MRSTIEAVFYHYPLPVLAELINNKRGDEDMLSVVAEIIKWKLKEFSSTEIFTLKNIMQNEWMTDVKRNFLPGGTPAYLRAFLVLNRFTDSVLCTSHDRQPIVKFDNLLRWHETSLLVSEDLLTTDGYDCKVAFTTFGATSTSSSGGFLSSMDDVTAFVENINTYYENTNYILGLENAKALVDSNTGRNTTVIFLSDGQPHTDTNGSTRTDLSTITPDLTAAPPALELGDLKEEDFTL